MDKHNWNPAELLQLSGGYWSACALHAGVKLDLFSHAGTASELAQVTACEPRGLEMLLNALTALELMEKEGDRFAATPFAAEYLSRNSPSYLGYIIMHHHHLMAGWSRLDESERESFEMGMFNLAMLNAPKVVARVDLQGKRRLLDLGGGPGTYAIHFCQANPQLTATVYAAALEPGGMLMVQEFILADTMASPLFPALFSLNMLLGTPQGRSYSQRQLEEMMTAAGAKSIRRLELDLPNGAGVLVGIV